MKSAEAFESITVLKNKFEEIRSNILNIEKDKVRKLEEFQTGQAPAKRFEYIRPASTSKLRDCPRQHRNTQSFQNDDSSESMSFLKKQIQELQEVNCLQAVTIENLKQENSQLKARLEEKVLEEKNPNKPRPQSCLRQSSSSPKKARVAFAQELTKVQFIPSATDPTITEQADNENQSLARKRVAEYIASARIEYDSPPKVKYSDGSLRSYMQEKRQQFNKLSSMSFDNDVPNYFRERSLKIANKILKE